MAGKARLDTFSLYVCDLRRRNCFRFGLVACGADTSLCAQLQFFGYGGRWFSFILIVQISRDFIVISCLFHFQLC